MKMMLQMKYLMTMIILILTVIEVIELVAKKAWIKMMKDMTVGNCYLAYQVFRMIEQVITKLIRLPESVSTTPCYDCTYEPQSTALRFSCVTMFDHDGWYQTKTIEIELKFKIRLLI